MLSKEVNGKATGGDKLEEVIVTAQKRSERLLSTPVSVTALSHLALEKADMQSPADLAQHVPALQVQSPLGDSNPVFGLRGVSMNDFAANQSGPVALYTDEVYRSGSVFFSDQLYDLQRVEVLRGPQGTLYGKNATGGAINFITAQPGFDTQGFIRAGVGNYSRVETEGAYQQAITDKIAARIAFDYKSADGFLKNVYQAGADRGGINEYGVRLSVLFQPLDSLKVTFQAATSATGPDPYADKASATSTGIGGGLYSTFHQLSPASNLNTDYFPLQHGVGSSQTSAGTPTYLRTGSNDLALNVHWDVNDELSFISLTSFNDGYFRVKDDGDTSPLSALTYLASDSGQQYAEDVRLDYHSQKLNLLGGLYYSNDNIGSSNGDYYYSDIDFNGDRVLNYKDCLSGQSQGLFPSGCFVGNSFQQNRVSEAVYTDGNYSITDALRVRLGVRYTRDELNISQYSAYTLGNDGIPLFNNIPGSSTNVFAQADPSNNVFTKVTGRLGLDYTFENGVLVYGTLSRGYRSGAVNSSAFFQPAEFTIAQPETLNSVEIGAKGEFFDRKLRVAASGFLYGYQNQQAVSTNPVSLAYQEVNIGRSSLKGIEIEATGKPIRDLTIGGSIALLNTKINTAVVNGLDLAGQQLPTAPKVSANFDVDWTAFRTDAYVVSLSPSARYTSPQYFLLGAPAGTVGGTGQGAYWLFDARASIVLQSQPLTVSLWVKNLGDKLYAKSLTSGFAYGIESLATVGEPRTFGLEARYSF